MPAYDSHATLLEREGSFLDEKFREAVAEGIDQPVTVVFDLLDPMAREMAILMEMVSSEDAEGTVEPAESNGESATVFCWLPHDLALQVFAHLLEGDLDVLESPLPPGNYLVAVFAANEVAFHQRTINLKS